MADWTKTVAPPPAPKKAVSIRLDTDVLTFFKARGKGYQTHINAVLLAYVRAQQAVPVASLSGTATASATPAQNLSWQVQDFVTRCAHYTVQLAGKDDDEPEEWFAAFDQDTQRSME